MKLEEFVWSALSATGMDTFSEILISLVLLQFFYKDLKGGFEHHVTSRYIRNCELTLS